MLNKAVRLLRDKKGMSMVTVIVSFVLLLITFAMYTAALKTASNLLNWSVDNRREFSNFLDDYYSGDSSVNISMVHGTVRLVNISNPADRITADATVEKAEDSAGKYSLYKFS